jgi:hypothetical protein
LAKVEDTIDPVRDLATITAELCAKDAAYLAASRAAHELDVKKNPKFVLPVGGSGKWMFRLHNELCKRNDL